MNLKPNHSKTVYNRCKLFINMDRDAVQARCWGLVGGVARKKEDNSKVSASFVIKNDGPFFCSVCLSDAIVRKCTEKADHFAHKGRLSPAINSKNIELHNKCKNEIWEYLKSKFPNGNWATERAIPPVETKGWKNELVPDISGRFGTKKDPPVAIEIQKTAYTLNRIHDKTIEYAKRNIFVIWIVPLSKDLGKKPFRPRLYEKYLHSIYYGRTYYWTPQSSPKIIPIHYSPTKRWIEEKTWFDVEEGEEKTAGGFYLSYKTLKNPNYGQECFLDKDFKPDDRPCFMPKNQKKKVPKCKIFIDKNAKWWAEDEYKNLKSQRTITAKIDFLKDYEYFDDFDDELY